MRLVSKDACEFRIKRVYENKNGGVSYFYTFENDEVGSFELWCKEDIKDIKKGNLYTLVFNLSFYQGEQRINLIEVLPYVK